MGGVGGDASVPMCGNGVPETGEECDEGSANADRPAFLLEQGGFALAIEPLDRVVSASQFYAYGSASSHTGFEALLASRLILYRDVTTGVLSLVMHHGIDLNTSGQSQPVSTVEFDINGLPTVVVVSVADDNPPEFFKPNQTSALGRWGFRRNSDGGALSGFPIPGSWSITIDPRFVAGISEFTYVDFGGLFVPLNLTQRVRITAFDSPSTCRTDCTIPFCGDDVLDGGEVCDDGNNVGGDGCAADCQSLN